MWCTATRSLRRLPVRFGAGLAFKPVIKVLGLLSMAVSKSDEGPDHTEDDIRAVVSLTRRSGSIKPYEEQSIKNILSLDSKVVEEIMTPRTVVFSLPSDMTVAEARGEHPSWPHSRIRCMKTTRKILSAWCIVGRCLRHWPMTG